MPLLPPERRLDALLVANCMAIAAREAGVAWRRRGRHVAESLRRSTARATFSAGPERDRGWQSCRRFACDLRIGAFENSPDARGPRARYPVAADDRQAARVPTRNSSPPTASPSRGVGGRSRPCPNPVSARPSRPSLRGEIVVVTDDDDRENEGDLILAAVHATPEKMAFIIRHTCGIVCAPLTGEIARRLHLAPMVADSDAIHGTAFTVSVDYRHGTTTGISADDRTATIRNLANGNAGRADFVRPGHIFPLIAKDGGVLMRSGHTEAAVDFCRLSGLEPVAAICELVNDDGTVMRGPQVAAFA